MRLCEAGAEEDRLNIEVKGVLKRESDDISTLLRRISSRSRRAWSSARDDVVGSATGACAAAVGGSLPGSIVSDTSCIFITSTLQPFASSTFASFTVSESYCCIAASRSTPFFPATSRSAILSHLFSLFFPFFSASPFPFLLLFLRGPSFTFASALAPGLNLQSGYFFLCSASATIALASQTSLSWRGRVFQYLPVS